MGRGKEGGKGRERKRETDKQRNRKLETDREDKKFEGSWGRKAILQPLRRSKVHMKFIKCTLH